MVEIRLIAQVDREACISCGACPNVCPTESITISEKGAKASVESEKCLACPNCVGVCPVNAIKMIEREEPLRFDFDYSDVDEEEIVQLCIKANLHPHQWLCLCTTTRVQEGAAAVLKGARTPEEISLLTGVRSGCTAYCLQPMLRLLKAHGVEIKQPSGHRWYDTTQTLWEVPKEVADKYPGHFLEEDKDVFRKV